MSIKKIFSFISLGIITIATIICMCVLCVPKVQNQAYSLSSTEQTYVDYIKNYTVIENTDNIFQTHTYQEISENIVGFSSYYNILNSMLESSKNELNEEDRAAVNSKKAQVEAIGDRLEIYLELNYFEAKRFREEVVALFNYDTITLDRKAELVAQKELHKKFWEDKIFISYLPYSASETEEQTITGEERANEAKKLIDDCLNKIVAIEEAPTKLAYFKEQIESLPQIVDVKKEDKEKLNKLKKELDEYYETYGKHLSNSYIIKGETLDSQNNKISDKRVLEDYKWQVEKSLDRIKDSDNNWAIFWIVLIIGAIFGIYLFIRYLIIPMVKNKFFEKGRKK